MQIVDKFNRKNCILEKLNGFELLKRGEGAPAQVVKGYDVMCAIDVCQKFMQYKF